MPLHEQSKLSRKEKRELKRPFLMVFPAQPIELASYLARVYFLRLPGLPTPQADIA